MDEYALAVLDVTPDVGPVLLQHARGVVHVSCPHQRPHLRTNFVEYRIEARHKGEMTINERPEHFEIYPITLNGMYNVNELFGGVEGHTIDLAPRMGSHLGFTQFLAQGAI